MIMNQRDIRFPIQIMKIIQFIITTALALLAHTQDDLTPYSQEEQTQIIMRQKKQWENIQLDFAEASVNCFRVETRIDFFLDVKDVPQTVKMKGRGFFYDEGKLKRPEILSPFDTTKVYVYSQNGLIISSEQFYTSFAFKFSIKANEKYRVVFVDGPPGPPKVIIWETAFERAPVFQNPASNNFYKQTNARISSITNYIEEVRINWQFTNTLFSQASENRIKDQKSYLIYLKFQTGLIMLCLMIQMKMMDRIIASENSMIL